MGNVPESVHRLVTIGFDRLDAEALRRISMTLHRWHELECGDSNDYASWCVTRGRKVDGAFVHDEDDKLPGSRPHIERHPHDGSKTQYTPIADKERGALRRLAKIMSRYPGFASYVQGDPRGCALYILRPGDVRDGEDVSSVYSRGIAVYK